MTLCQNWCANTMYKYKDMQYTIICRSLLYVYDPQDEINGPKTGKSNIDDNPYPQLMHLSYTNSD